MASGQQDGLQRVARLGLLTQAWIGFAAAVKCVKTRVQAVETDLINPLISKNF